MNAVIKTQKAEPPANDRLTETDYPARRGLSLQTLKKHGVYYESNWRHPNAPSSVPGTPRLIVPVQGGNILARDTREYIPPEQEPYKKSKVKVNENAGWTFNAEALTTTGEGVIFAVEGEFDAMSIEEVGGVAVGLGSIANARGFIDQLKATPPSVPIVVAYDNEADPEKAERINKAARDLAEDIKSLGFEAVAIDPKLLTGGCKDANEALVKDRDAFGNAVKKLTALYRRPLAKEQQEFSDISGLNGLRDIVDGIKSGRQLPCLSTGFKAFDKQLDGGLYSEVHIIGAPSSLGKTSLVMQIADYVAQHGSSVLFFSFEMSRLEIVAKSLSRLTAIAAMEHGLVPTENASTARDIMIGSRFRGFSETKRKLIVEAVNRYKEFGDRIKIFESNGSTNAKTVSETVEKIIKATGCQPLVIIDYLQMLAPVGEHMTDKQAADATIKELCVLRRTYDVPVIAISSYARASYDVPASMSSFKESGNIEYNADLAIGLQLEGVGTKDFDVNAAKKAVPRKMELVIMKDRLGPVCTPVKLSFYAAYNLFVENIL